MSLMEQVREIGGADAHIDEKDVAAARRALMRSIGAAEPKAKRIARGRWIGVGGLVAASAVTAIVVGTVLAPPDASSASAAVFEEAAAGAEKGAAMPLEPGRYLKLETAFSMHTTWDADMPEGARFNNHDPEDAEAILVVQDRGTTWVPANADDVWVRERIPYTVVDAQGTGSAEALAEWAEQDPGRGLGGVSRYPGGLAEGGGGDGETFEYHLDDRELYADLPDDVPGVIDWFSSRYEGEGDANGLGHYFAETISDVSVFNLAPASARASMLRAFATLDGVEVVSTDADRSTLRYERTRTNGDTSAIDFVLDTERGYVLEVTSWPYGVDPDGEPTAPRWSSRTTATISVVDSAP